jgi:hypothetical protein
MKQIGCPVCTTPLTLSPAHSRKSKAPKVFLMMVCPEDGRHFRGFINDPGFVNRVVTEARIPIRGGTGTGRG